MGGTVLEELSRLGVGNIKIWDHDVLEEHNLNRQLLSTIEAIGQSKAGAARARVGSINPAVNLHAEASRFDGERDRIMICDCQVVVDCLDNISDRLALATLCREFKIPLVHGAVEGWMGQITTQFPEDRVIEAIYEQSQNASGKTTISTPAFTPAVVASLQAAEVVKILLGRGELLRGRIMLINLLDMDFDSIDIK